MMHAVSNYGERITLPGEHPRAELLEALGRKHAERIYVDKADGRTVVVGYVVARSWWSFYTVTPWEVPA